MSDSDDQYEVPSGGNVEVVSKVEVSVTEINKDQELDVESKNEDKSPVQGENLAQQMKLLAVIDQKQENKNSPNKTDKGSTSIIGNIDKNNRAKSLTIELDLSSISVEDWDQEETWTATLHSIPLDIVMDVTLERLLQIKEKSLGGTASQEEEQILKRFRKFCVKI